MSLAALQRLLGIAPLGRSLRVRILGEVMVLSVLGAVVSGTTVFVAARSVLVHQLRDRLASISADEAREMDRWITSASDEISYKAALPTVRASAARLARDFADTEARAALDGVLPNVHRDGAQFTEVFLLDAEDARVLASTHAHRNGTFEFVSGYWTQGREGPWVQEVYPSAEDGTPALTVAAPVRAEDGTVVAVLVGHLDLSRLEGLFSSQPGLTAASETYLVSEVGDFVSSIRFGRDEFRRGPHSDGVERALDGQTGVDVYDNYRGVPVVGAYRWMPKRRLALLLEVPEPVALAPARRLGLVTMSVALVVALLLGLSSVTLANQIVSPLLGLSQAARRVADGDFQARVPESGDDEVADLARSFNGMTARIESVYHDLKNQIETTTTAYEAVEEGRALLQAIVDNSTSLITVTDRKGTLHLVNRRFEELFGEVGDLLGRRLETVLPAETAEAYLVAERAALDGEKVVKTALTLDRPDGTLHFLAVAFPLEDSTVHGGEVGLIAIDTTDRVRADEERSQLEAQLRRAQRLESLGLLAGGIAHDFNNLLQVISGHSALAEEVCELGEAEHHLAQVRTAASRAAELTGQLLAYAGRRSLAAGYVELNKVVRDLAELIAVAVPKSARLETGLGEQDLPVAADPSQVGQVVMNLIANAVDALPDGRGTVRVRTEGRDLGRRRTSDDPPRDVLPDGRYGVLVVGDTGIGMDDATLERIFDPFFTTKEFGHGLGLAAVLGIVRSAGGHLLVRSKPRVGTTFRIFFPLLEDAAPAPPAPRKRALGGHALEGCRILVADDEPGVRTLVKRTLELDGAAVVAVGDGDEAVVAFHEHGCDFDGAVLDLSMPGRGGVEVLEEIRVERPSLPVVLASGFDVSDTLGDVADDPYLGFLQKPFRPADLVDRLCMMGACRGAARTAGEVDDCQV